MEKYIILHNHLDKNSRDFVAEITEYPIISWYENGELLQEYMAKCLPSPSMFPCVVDTELKLICNGATSVIDAITSFSSYITKTRYDKLASLRTARDAKLIEVDIMINELALGLRGDTSAISTYRTALLNITTTYKDESGNPTSAIDSFDIGAFEWPIKP